MSEVDLLPPLTGHSLVYSETPVKCAYLFGGWDGTTLFNDLWIFNLEEQAWKRLRKPEEQVATAGNEGTTGEENK